jgi:hypothetical protein
MLMTTTCIICSKLGFCMEVVRTSAPATPANQQQQQQAQQQRQVAALAQAVIQGGPGLATSFDTTTSSKLR